MGSIARQFWNGLTRPSGLAISIAVALQFCIFAALLVVITPRLLIDYGDDYLSAKRKDYDLFASTVSLRLKEEDTSRRKLVIIGGSNTH